MPAIYAMNLYFKVQKALMLKVLQPFYAYYNNKVFQNNLEKQSIELSTLKY